MQSTNESVEQVVENNLCVFFDNCIEVELLSSYWNLKENAMRKSPVLYLQM